MWFKIQPFKLHFCDFVLIDSLKGKIENRFLKEDRKEEKEEIRKWLKKESERRKAWSRDKKLGKGGGNKKIKGINVKR